jgi:hypothetical protein
MSDGNGQKEVHLGIIKSENCSAEGMMKFKVNEDWLSVGIALLLMVLALVGLIDPNWMKF